MLKFDSEQLEFNFKTANGKIGKKMVTVDEYTYLVTSSMQMITKKDLGLLDRTTEQSGSVNPVRQSFFRVNANGPNTFMPRLFELNQELFTHIKDFSMSKYSFQRQYAYYTMPALSVI